ncbi:hypothetical protein [Terrihabitans rhizophilus]|uniref:Uncharacterized protein n=1 Tax=Terrihabitans rhizophilus TaxID=3092662 RepID=A0ABU4RPC9_9HYPH|nr:hypothetical protein [Terrihabitans sp. PJ23]MDX6806705.1 hypothetical protein [Terrihabitans sp. PJ23]
MNQQDDNGERRQSERDPFLVAAIKQSAELLGMRFVVDDEKLRQFNSAHEPAPTRRFVEGRFSVS